MNAVTTPALAPPPPPAGDASPSTDHRRALWEMLYRKAGHAPHLSTAHEGGRFSIANEVAHRIVREGVTGQVLAPLGELLDLGVTQLAPVLGVDRATARRYARNDQALPMHSAETVLRLAELESLALDVFASEQAAHGWLRKAHPLLGESPIDAASTSYGGQRVREMLIAIQHGGVA